MTTAPATISAIPSMAGRSNRWSCTSQATNEISTMPAPDQSAYAMPTGITRNVAARH